MMWSDHGDRAIKILGGVTEIATTKSGAFGTIIQDGGLPVGYLATM